MTTTTFQPILPSYMLCFALHSPQYIIYTARIRRLLWIISTSFYSYQIAFCADCQHTDFDFIVDTISEYLPSTYQRVYSAMNNITQRNIYDSPNVRNVSVNCTRMHLLTLTETLMFLLIRSRDKALKPDV